MSADRLTGDDAPEAFAHVFGDLAGLRLREPEAVIEAPCTTCGQTMRVVERLAGAAVCQPCEHAADAARERAGMLLAAIGTLPGTLRDAEFNRTAHKRVHGSVEDVQRAIVAADEGRSLTLEGPPKAGKSSLAAALARRVWEASLREDRGLLSMRRILWCNAFRLGMARALHPLGTGEAPEVLAALAAPTLVIDDFGQEPRVEGSPLAQIIFERFEQGRATWITTGLDRRAVANRYGGMALRRVFEDVEVVKLHAPKGEGGNHGR